jgi:hypothetical protein
MEFNFGVEDAFNVPMFNLEPTEDYNKRSDFKLSSQNVIEVEESPRRFS